MIRSDNLEAMFNARDERAYPSIYNRYWNVLLDAAYKRVRDIQLAEDLVQDVFISLFLKKDTLIIEGTLENYLRAALRYKILTSFRSDQIHGQYLRSVVPQTSDEDPETLMSVKELKDRIRRAIDQIPDKPRRAFELSKLHLKSHKEVAAELGIAVSTVEKHIRKARKLLEGQLGNPLTMMVMPVIFIFFKNP